MSDEEWGNLPCPECSGTNKLHNKPCPYWECPGCLATDCGGCQEDYDDHALDVFEESK